MLIQLLFSLAIFLLHANAFDVTKNPFDTFKLSKDVIGVHSVSSSHNTPPSTITSEWNILFKDGNSDKTKLPDLCPENASICGVIKYHDDKNSDDRPLQILSLSEENIKYSNDDNNPIVASWEGVQYGDYKIDVSVNFQCIDSTEFTMEWVNASSTFDSNILLNIKHKDFCNTDGGNKDNKDKNNDKDSGLGFFGSTIIIMAVIFAGYLVAQAWFNTSTMGSSGDFMNELVDVVVESLSSIPRLLMEVIGKITGGSNSSRGGYSAV